MRGRPNAPRVMNITPNLERYIPVPESGCWLWEGPVSCYGYGLARLGKRATHTVAHRFFYAAHKGPIPPGMCVCHKCDTKLCVNPDHLFLGTHADNMRDRAIKGGYLGPRNPRWKHGRYAGKSPDQYSRKENS